MTAEAGKGRGGEGICMQPACWDRLSIPWQGWKPFPLFLAPLVHDDKTEISLLEHWNVSEACSRFNCYRQAYLIHPRGCFCPKASPHRRAAVFCILSSGSSSCVKAAGPIKYNAIIKQNCLLLFLSFFSVLTTWMWRNQKQMVSEALPSYRKVSNDAFN